MQARIFAAPDCHSATYHVTSRVVDRDKKLGDAEREQFRLLLHQLLAFCGLEALTWCCLSNHFHILLRVPGQRHAEDLRAAISEEQLFERMNLAFSDQFIRETRWRVEHARKEMKNEAWAQDILNRLKGQMFDLSKFMQMLKRRFSAWFNKKHERRGTLWEERYGSVLVEDSENAIRLISTYIDLNPVRAGIVDDPKDYRWCGYSEALAGDRRARKGIETVVGATNDLRWPAASEAYRCWLFDHAERTEDRAGRTVRRGLSREAIEKVWADGGRLSRQQLLQCRIRYLTSGVAIGRREFVEGVFERYRDRFGARRNSGARPMRRGEWGGLCSLRDLQKDVIRPPD